MRDLDMSVVVVIIVDSEFITEVTITGSCF